MVKNKQRVNYLPVVESRYQNQCIWCSVGEYFAIFQNALECKLITKAPNEICDFRLPSNCQSACFLSVSLFNALSLGCRLGYAYIAGHPWNSFFVFNSPFVSAFSLFALSSCSFFFSLTHFPTCFKIFPKEKMFLWNVISYRFSLNFVYLTLYLYLTVFTTYI